MGEPAKAKAEFMKARQSSEMIGKMVGGVYIAYLNSELGKFEEGSNFINQDFEMLKRAGQKVWIARYHLGFSRIFSQKGQSERALNEAEQAWIAADDLDHLEYKRGALHLKGLAQLGLNDVTEAEKTAGLLKELIEDGLNKKIIHLYYHLKGEIELKKGNQTQAVDFFKQALTLLEYGPLATDALYINSLALAYYRSGDLDKSLLEYERITSLTSGRLDRGELYAKSFYMLGKIYEQLGETTKAKENYEKFLDLWKDADPGIPEIEEARKKVEGMIPNV